MWSIRSGYCTLALEQHTERGKNMKIYVINYPRDGRVVAAYSGCTSLSHAIQTFVDRMGYTLLLRSRDVPSRFYVVEGGLIFTVQTLVVEPVLDGA